MSKIMVVDDEAYISTQLEERLASMDYEVVGTASSGEGSISMARKVHPDLVLMDIVMPGKLDGIEASKIITRDLDIPVIFLTAHTDDEFLERAKQIEPFGYILKPFQEKEIKANIELALYKKEKERLLQQSNRQLIDKLESITDGFFSIDDELVITYFNEVAGQLLGRETEKVVGRNLFEVFSETRGTIFEKKFIHAVRKKIPDSIEAYLGVRPYGNWFEFKLYPQENEISIYFYLITEHKLAEERLMRHREQLSALNTIVAAVNSSLDLDEVLNTTLDKVMDVIKPELSGIFIQNEQTNGLDLKIYRLPPSAFIDDFSWPSKEFGLLEQCVNSGEPIVIPNAIQYPGSKAMEAVRKGILSCIILPLRSKEKVVGTLYIGYRNVRSFSREFMSMLTTISHQIGVAVENARLYAELKKCSHEMEKR